MSVNENQNLAGVTSESPRPALAKKINWNLIAHLPADGIVYLGSPEYGAFLVCHRPATKMHVEQLLAETGDGLNRRRMTPRKNKPHNWAQNEQKIGMNFGE